MLVFDISYYMNHFIKYGLTWFKSLLAVSHFVDNVHEKVFFILN